MFVDGAALCRDWQAIMISKNDRLTEGPGSTASQIEANNNSRIIWGCDRTQPKPAA